MGMARLQSAQSAQCLSKLMGGHTGGFRSRMGMAVLQSKEMERDTDRAARKVKPSIESRDDAP